jgi:hypothetical protein
VPGTTKNKCEENGTDPILPQSSSTARRRMNGEKKTKGGYVARVARKKKDKANQGAPQQ